MNTDQQFIWLIRFTGLFGLLLIAVTWPLWTVTSNIPQIPWLSWLCSLPSFVDLLALVFTLIGLVGLVVSHRSPHWIRNSIICFVLGWSMLISLDQHRLQPWAWQFLILGYLLAVTLAQTPSLSIPQKRTCIFFWQLITISIYFYSGISKADASFLSSHGQLLLHGLFAPLSINSQFWSEQTMWWLAAMLPMGELLVAFLLLFPKTRRWGCVSSWMMHSLLLITLGPWGLNHEPGVLLWNVYFMIQNYFLFWIQSSESKVDAVEKSGYSNRIAQIILLMALITPLLESFGLWDHWPAWAVYCSRPEKVEVFINVSDLEQLPERLQKFIGKPAPFSDKVPFNLDAMSFELRNCPPYPQARYRVALALAVLGTAGVREESVSISVSSTPDRWTGERTKTELNGLLDIAQACEDFKLNTHPRFQKQVGKR